MAREGGSFPLESDLSEDDARAYWTAPGLSTYVAKAEGQVVGTYAMKSNGRGPASHVANAGYMVRGGWSGRGVGTTLGLHSLEMARAAGFLAMQFNGVVSTNDRAIALWTRLGFKIVGTVPRAFRHPRRGFVDIHIMHRALLRDCRVSPTGRAACAGHRVRMTFAEFARSRQ